MKESDIEELLNNFNEPVSVNEGILAPNRDAIDGCFMNKTSMEEIEAALMSLATPWSEKTIETLFKMSPTSLKVTLRGLNEGKHLSIEDSFKLEYRMSQGFMLKGSDFYEGIRALLIDKDKNPCWNPDNLDSVDETIVDRYFRNLGNNEWSAF